MKYWQNFANISRNIGENSCPATRVTVVIFLHWQECFVWGKGGRCLVLRNLLFLCIDCLEIWVPQPPWNLEACPGPHRDCCTFSDTLPATPTMHNTTHYSISLWKIHCYILHVNSTSRNTRNTNKFPPMRQNKPQQLCLYHVL